MHNTFLDEVMVQWFLVQKLNHVSINLFDFNCIKMVVPSLASQNIGIFFLLFCTPILTFLPKSFMKFATKIAFQRSSCFSDLINAFIQLCIASSFNWILNDFYLWKQILKSKSIVKRKYFPRSAGHAGCSTAVLPDKLLLFKW